MHCGMRKVYRVFFFFFARSVSMINDLSIMKKLANVSRHGSAPLTCDTFDSGKYTTSTLRPVLPIS